MLFLIQGKCHRVYKLLILSIKKFFLPQLAYYTYYMYNTTVAYINKGPTIRNPLIRTHCCVNLKQILICDF